MTHIRKILGTAAVAAGLGFAQGSGQGFGQGVSQGVGHGVARGVAQGVGHGVGAGFAYGPQGQWQGIVDSEQLRQQIEEAMRASKNLSLDQFNYEFSAAQRALSEVDMQSVRDELARVGKNIDMSKLTGQLKDAEWQLENLRAGGFGNLSSLAGLGFAFVPQQGGGVNDKDRAREQAERAREVRERLRESVERLADNEQRKIDLYREGTGNVDEGKYEVAVSRFNRLLEADAKWSRADGALYWKAYALNKLGKRDEALAALGEIPKQFPQSRWINDAKALQVEVQQSSGRGVSPDSIDDQDLKLLAINSLMNSAPEQAVPLLEKVLNDPKNNLSLKAKALFVLAQSRSEKARDIVGGYAKSGSNPDLQIRAIGYLGSFRMKDSQQILADVYGANSDVAVKRAVLRALSTSRDNARLSALAKNEANAELRREAIRGLGNMQAANELAVLYSTETNAELKETILSSMMNARATEKLIEIAKSEKNAELRGDAIRYLANTRGEKSAEALTSLYTGETEKTVKSQIIRSLGSQQAGKQLVELTRNEKDPQLKAEGVQWLGRMHGSKEATDYLMEIISK